MAKLHTHYITNAQKELKYAYAGIPDDVFQSSVQKALSDAKARDDFVEDEDGDDFDDDDKDDADDQEDQEEEGHNSNIRNQRYTEIENWIDINDPELKRLLNIEVNVVIEPRPLPIINHGSSEFDIEATVDKVLGYNSNSNNNS
jgi:hypothetical protein